MPDRPPPETSSIPLEDIAGFPLPGMSVPGSLAFSPDDRLITYLHSPERSLERRLYTFDPESGQHRLWIEPPGSISEEDMSIVDALRRERQHQRELGVTQYAWTNQSSHLLVPYFGQVYVSEGRGSRCAAWSKGVTHWRRAALGQSIEPKAPSFPRMANGWLMFRMPKCLLCPLPVVCHAS